MCISQPTSKSPLLSTCVDLIAFVECYSDNVFHLLSTRCKASIAECSKLCVSFPAIVTLILHGVPVKNWHELSIADHMPGEQCALALTTKMKSLLQADQVSDLWLM